MKEQEEDPLERLQVVIDCFSDLLTTFSTTLWAYVDKCYDDDYGDGDFEYLLLWWCWKRENKRL